MLIYLTKWNIVISYQKHIVSGCVIIHIQINPSGADIETLAWAVIRGEYGNNPERKERLIEEYDEDTYNAVQERVNQLKAEGAW